MAELQKQMYSYLILEKSSNLVKRNN